MEWYWLVLIVIGYLLIGVIACGLLERFTEASDYRDVKNRSYVVFFWWLIPFIVLALSSNALIDWIAGKESEWKS